jgi:hypothetical protein
MTQPLLADPNEVSDVEIGVVALRVHHRQQLVDQTTVDGIGDKGLGLYTFLWLCHFIKLLYDQVVISSTCYVIKLSNDQVVI